MEGNGQVVSTEDRILNVADVKVVRGWCRDLSGLSAEMGSAAEDARVAMQGTRGEIVGLLLFLETCEQRLGLVRRMLLEFLLSGRSLS